MHSTRLLAIITVGILAGCATSPRAVPPTDPTTPVVGAAPAWDSLQLVVESDPFARAVAAGTRTRTGLPGNAYWQQYASYVLHAELDPAAARLRGRGTIQYHNRSPRELPELAMHLHQNLHSPGALRNRAVPITGGVSLERVAVNGAAIPATAAPSDVPGYRVEGTVAWVRLPQPLAPGASVELEVHWAFTVPPVSAPRMGQDGEVYFLGYWYPQMAVFDDISGWHVDQYLGNAEFHMGFADYDVQITLPAGWVVAATGDLVNAEDVLPGAVRARLARARQSGEVVTVIGASDHGAGTATSAGFDGWLTWQYRARHVRDFAFGASERFVWDATRALIDGDRAGAQDTIMVHALYRPGTRTWDQSARYGRHSVEFLSRYLWPYPYRHMTSVEGIIPGGMEFPMITLIGGDRDTLALYSVTVHEIAHMWFPMQVASDEKRHAWQDEGLARFVQAQAMREFFRGYDLEALVQERYRSLALESGEVELMRHGDLYPPGTRAFVVASYDKPAAVLVALRALLGEELFLRALREYGRSWVNRHPQPEDLWNSFDRVSGRDLRWFWRSWFYETWTLEHAIASVTESAGWVEIVVEDRGSAPMPARLAVTRATGGVERLEIPVDIWLQGHRRQSIRLRATPAITSIRIDPEHDFPYLTREGLEWTP
jgi:hypothetical protein